MSRRLSFIIIFVLFLYLILISRLVYLQIFQFSVYQKKADAYRLRVLFIKPRRGKILDRKGRVLAKDQGAFSLVVTPKDFDPALLLVYAFYGSQKIWNRLAKKPKKFPFFLTPLSPRQASRLFRLFSKKDSQRFLQVKWQEDKMELWLKKEIFEETFHKLKRISHLLEIPFEKLMQRWQAIQKYANTMETNYERKVFLRTPQTLYSPLTPKEIRKLELAEIQGLSVKAKSIRKYFFRNQVGHILGRISFITPKEYRVLRKEGKILHSRMVQKLEISKEELERIQKGFFLDEKIGRSGLEKVGDTWLRGKKGIQWVERDARNRIVKILKEIPAQGGKDLVLTLDLKLQNSLYQSFLELDKKIQKGLLKSKTGYAVGAAVAINPSNGEVLALFSYPPITSNRKQLYPFINRAIAASYPPGSIFKPISALAFMETEKVKGKPWKVTPQTKVFCAHRYKGSRYFKCLGYHGETNLVRALQKSCNIYFYKLGEELGGELLSHWAAKLGLSEKTGIELAGEKLGNLPSPMWKKKRYGPQKGRWYPGDSRNFAIGQGYLTVTPIGILRALTALFNGGEVLKLHILKKNPKEVIRKLFFHTESLEAIYEGMKAVAQRGGTAFGSGLEDFEVAVKTGSAQDGRGWNFAWIAGVSWGKKGSPAYPRIPSIAFVVMIEHTSGHGGHTAGPIAAKLLEAFYKGDEEKSQKKD